MARLRSGELVPLGPVSPWTRAAPVMIRQVRGKSGPATSLAKLLQLRQWVYSVQLRQLIGGWWPSRQWQDSPTPSVAFFLVASANKGAIASPCENGAAQH